MIKLHKIEIARRQIEVATELFFEGGDFLAVITLAGAAEKILGSIIRRNKKQKAMFDILVEVDKKEFGGRSHLIVNNELNGTRNALKHANHESEDEIEIEEGEAIAMLSRAVANYATLNGGEAATSPMIRLYEYLKAQNLS